MIGEDGDWLEPRLTMSIPDASLSNTNFSTYIYRYPCHSQAVERIVQIMSQSSKMLANPSQRDSRTYTTILLRRKMPIFDTKCQFVF